MNNYQAFYKNGGIKISTIVGAKNKSLAKIVAAKLFSTDNLLPDAIKQQIAANNVNVKRLYKNKKAT